MKALSRVGIIGCGRISGWNELDPDREKPCTHVGAYRMRADVLIAGCCDLNLQMAEKFATNFNIPFFTDSVAELLKEKLDIVSVCIPYKFNRATISKIARSKNKPKKILLEKPIADNLSDAKKILELCDQNNIKLYVNNRRLSPFYQNFKKVIAEKFQNKIISIGAWCSSGMHTIGIHMVDLLRSVAGDVDSVYATCEKECVHKLPYSANFTPDDLRYNAFIVFKNGIEAMLFNSARTDYTFFEVEAICKTGRVRAADNGNRLMYQEKITPKGSTLSYRLGKENEVHVSKEPLFKRLIDEVIDGSYKNSPINGQEALKSYQVIEAMKKSARTRKVQYIND
ncbi:MAG: Gfo/Idh/MocA family oxidoreductase [Candidatus Omnitrophica bacterium]|nr:Gfo/Idh/MocA family oxidoreductase [Candidatus Omnitrophota bacterium]